ncbi:MAG: hypothetical protein KDK36_01135, partial [Leptospiraceae bacterium]|nr:hypothetical protein [Leptospiraceae bacterium]
MKKLLVLSILLLNYCTSAPVKDPDGYFYVRNVKGINEIDAELNAKRKILEMGLGELVEGGSQTIDGESKE